ncbi:YraN family protein [Ammoniphilus sp. YIM 78166]|uniref:YraN family protein n=1 Tax=Ammoniphilus sp. YIM 78166 TaxID=1644106 RepID=UPI0014302F9B|nr:YraN family protein [Ammoniphilus sp. YIM 78166]
MSKREQEWGRLGESAAARYLEERGYVILERNLRLLRHEMDIVAEREGLIVFVEVKTRTTELYGSGAESVTQQKQRRLIRFAELFLLRYPLGKQVRFDVITISVNRENGQVKKVVHFPNAFELM